MEELFSFDIGIADATNRRRDAVTYLTLILFVYGIVYFLIQIMAYGVLNRSSDSVANDEVRKWRLGTNLY